MRTGLYTQPVIRNGASDNKKRIKLYMALSLTSLDDAYMADPDAVQSVQLPKAVPSHVPALPDHGKKDRPVSLREDIAPTASPYPDSVLFGKRTKAKQESVTESFTDKMWSHKREMLRMLTMALIVTTGLAFHNVLLEFLVEYTAGAKLTYWNDKVAKLCYPAIVMAAIWCIKSAK
jgi:hypothetical protein